MRCPAMPRKEDDVTAQPVYDYSPQHHTQARLDHEVCPVKV
jgi:hypothetical protein